MTGARGADAVAQLLRDAYARGPEAGRDEMIRLFADQVELRHVPPHPSDGLIDGAVLAAVTTREIAAARRALADLTQDDVVLHADGDSLDFAAATHGTMRDGTQVEVHVKVRFTIADGRIIGMESRLDAEAMAHWHAVLDAGGFFDADGSAVDQEGQKDE